MTSPLLGLEPKSWQAVIKIFKRVLPPNTNIIFFGSRVVGGYKKYSDLDVAIQESINSKISDRDLVILDELFAESDLPFKVDIIDLRSTEEDFQKRIFKNCYSQVL